MTVLREGTSSTDEHRRAVAPSTATRRLWTRLVALAHLLSSARPGSGRWGRSALYAVPVTAAVCAPTWPGLMSFDSLYAYRQSVTGVETAVWPPAHDYLMYLSRVLTGGPGGLFATQVFVLFLSAAVLLHALLDDVRRAAVAFGLFVAAFVWFPTLIGTAIVSWKDVPLTAFGLLAVALWVANLRQHHWGKVVGVGLALLVAVSVRHNGLPLLVPFLVLFVAQPAMAAAGRTRALAAAVVASSLVLAFASTVWRLPDLQRLPSVEHALLPVQSWDLVGMSVCEGEVLLPPSVQGATPYTVAELEAVYDPRHLNLTFQELPGRRNVAGATPAQAPETERAWRSAVLHHPGCYLRHRNNVLAEQMGLRATVFYPTHGGIDENEFGIALAHPALVQRVIGKIVLSADGAARRAVWLYLLAAGALVLCAVRRRGASPLAVALFLGALAYTASLYFLSPAADARYIFPCNVLCALVVCLVLGRLLPAPVLPRAAAAWWAGRRRPALTTLSQNR